MLHSNFFGGKSKEKLGLWKNPYIYLQKLTQFDTEHSNKQNIHNLFTIITIELQGVIHFLIKKKYSKTKNIPF